MSIFAKIKTTFFVNRFYNHYLYCDRLHDILVYLSSDLEDYYDKFHFKFKSYYTKGKYGYIVGTWIAVPKNIEDVIKELNDKRGGYFDDLTVKNSKCQRIKLYMKI